MEELEMDGMFIFIFLWDCKQPEGRTVYLLLYFYPCTPIPWHSMVNWLDGWLDALLIT